MLVAQRMNQSGKVAFPQMRIAPNAKVDASAVLSPGTTELSDVVRAAKGAPLGERPGALPDQVGFWERPRNGILRAERDDILTEFSAQYREKSSP
ncbi:hypothetical protein PYK79_23750 [Streptomyces sp. ID05-04B]|uniref:hypothetical protein n=1 Tax=Streptomyces sp. ID05-04B TaxID=3028661 RepID=UPI0029C14815|nr:hypothetical protein [Streptomyces sp. ID05-04B]MDX5565719.1 hypothetical protein [Streptomyces sp. ID05-04B]